MELGSHTCQTGGMSAETIARLHIVLNDIEPVIWRRVELPVTATLKMLHNTVQATMGWEIYHFWRFQAATGATACRTRCAGQWHDSREECEAIAR